MTSTQFHNAIKPCSFGKPLSTISPPDENAYQRTFRKTCGIQQNAPLSLFLASLCLPAETEAVPLK